ncbi:hypothetical protein [Lacipirellula parvula]|uniref:hypothetical protein n=1 Tax=Lacipirellula parvula TaxID=2650471 RepID=UPI001561C751|nr:hypothetical protein [Lacipirellula parvula]
MSNESAEGEQGNGAIVEAGKGNHHYGGICRCPEVKGSCEEGKATAKDAKVRQGNAGRGLNHDGTAGELALTRLFFAPLRLCVRFLRERLCHAKARRRKENWGCRIFLAHLGVLGGSILVLRRARCAVVVQFGRWRLRLLAISARELHGAKRLLVDWELRRTAVSND